MPIKYKEWVDYEALDPVKRLAMEIFESTLSHPERLGIKIVPETLGGTAVGYDFSGLDSTDFMVMDNKEGLGTKNKISDVAYQKIKEAPQLMKIAEFYEDAKYYRPVGTCTARMSINDLAVSGADPFSYMDIISCGDSDWYKDIEKIRQIFLGMKDAADEDLFAVPGGELPELKGIIYPDTLDLAGGSIGLVKPKSRYISPSRICAGDVIYGVESSGLHANGVSKFRDIASLLKEGYFTLLESRKTLGEEALTPTAGYVRPINTCLDEGVDIHFAQPITGHGWEKIARAKRSFNYEIGYIPEPSPFFRQLIEFGKSVRKPNGESFDMSDKENYFTWNMRVGMVLIAPASEGSKISRIFGKYGKTVYELGKVVPGERIVDMKPFGFQYKA